MLGVMLASMSLSITKSEKSFDTKVLEAQGSKVWPLAYVLSGLVSIDRRIEHMVCGLWKEQAIQLL